MPYDLTLSSEFSSFFFFSFPLVMLCCAKGFYVKAYGITLPCNPAFDRAGREGRKGRSLFFHTESERVAISSRVYDNDDATMSFTWESFAVRHLSVPTCFFIDPTASTASEWVPRARWLDVYNSSHRCRLKLWNVVMHAWVLADNMPSWRKNFHTTFMLLFFFVNPLHPAQLVRPENVP